MAGQGHVLQGSSFEYREQKAGGAEACGSCWLQVDECLSMLSAQQQRPLKRGTRKKAHESLANGKARPLWTLSRPSPSGRGNRTSHRPVPQLPHKDTEWPFGRWGLFCGAS